MFNLNDENPMLPKPPFPFQRVESLEECWQFEPIPEGIF